LRDLNVNGKIILTFISNSRSVRIWTVSSVQVMVLWWALAGEIDSCLFQRPGLLLDQPSLLYKRDQGSFLGVKAGVRFLAGERDFLLFQRPDLL
jgi:hypothetical protein